MSETQIRKAVVDLCGLLGIAHVWRVTATPGTNAALACSLRTLGLTAPNQCASFSAYVLADVDRTGRTFGTMGLARDKDPQHLVCQHLNSSGANARLPHAWTRQPRIRSTNNLRQANNGRVSLHLCNRRTNASVADREHCRLVSQRPV